MTLSADDRAALVIEVATLTKLAGRDLDDFVALVEHAPQLVPTVLANYGAQDWTDPATPAGQRFLEIVGALGGVGAAVGNVAGAVAGVKGAV